MDQGTLILVAFIKDLMIIISLGLLIIVLASIAVVAIRLQGAIGPVKRAAGNLEEASGVVLNSTRDISKTLGFFGAINRVVERVRERFRREEA